MTCVWEQSLSRSFPGRSLDCRDSAGQYKIVSSLPGTENHEEDGDHSDCAGDDGSDHCGARQVCTPKSSMPKCTEPLSNLDYPNGPHGLFVLEFPGLRPRAEAAHKYLLHNPVVCGANIYVVWSQVDRGPGASPRYDWTSVDERMKPWVSAGKIVNLVVWAVKPMGNGSATPDFIWSKVPSVECPHFSRAPVFWDKNFVTSYQTFMSAVMQKYGTEFFRRLHPFWFGSRWRNVSCLQICSTTPRVFRKGLARLPFRNDGLREITPLRQAIDDRNQPPQPASRPGFSEIGGGACGSGWDRFRLSGV